MTMNAKGETRPEGIKPSADPAFLAKEGTDRRLSERRIHPAVAEYAVQEHARLAEQVRLLREALFAQLDFVTNDWAYPPDWVIGARAALEATAPREPAKQEDKPQVSAPQLSDFGRADHDQDIAGRRLKPGS